MTYERSTTLILSRVWILIVTIYSLMLDIHLNRESNAKSWNWLILDRCMLWFKIVPTRVLRKCFHILFFHLCEIWMHVSSWDFVVFAVVLRRTTVWYSLMHIEPMIWLRKKFLTLLWICSSYMLCIINCVLCVMLWYVLWLVMILCLLVGLLVLILFLTYKKILVSIGDECS